MFGIQSFTVHRRFGVSGKLFKNILQFLTLLVGFGQFMSKYLACYEFFHAGYQSDLSLIKLFATFLETDAQYLNA